MRARSLAFAAVATAGLIRTGDAFAPTKNERPVVTPGRAPRVHRDVGWGKVAAGDLVGWHQIIDRDTDVPIRMWGPSIPAPGASADPAIAEAAARAFLAAHLGILAPGSAMSDFALSANVVDPRGAVRTLAFVQRAHDLAVIGGSIGVAFERDHLVLVSSTALPRVAVQLPGGPLPTAMLAASARDWLARGGHADTHVRARGDRAILPIVRPRGRSVAPDIEYRVVETVDVEAAHEVGRWDVWLDALDAAPVARRSTVRFATGKVMFDVPDRYPGGARSARPAPFENATVNGASAITAIDGTITWSGSAAATVVPALAGTFAKIINQAGTLAATTLTVPAGGQAVWNAATVDTADAQVDAYVFENTAKAFVKTNLNPNLAWLGQQVSVYVNENMTCNAYSTGDDLHFFVAKPGSCENTGRIADVVYHESGHSVHFQSIIPGQGQFDDSLSEGLADTLAVSITGDSGLGRGFFFNDAPLRELDPAVKKTYPADYTGEAHADGEIIGEALWDTRKALQAKLGDQAGFAQFLKVYYSVVQRAADIPTSFPEALLGDDDDGDLSNGTPNLCAITTAFAAHGLADPATALGLVPPHRDGYTVTMTVHPPAADCPVASVQSAVLDWNPRGGAGGELALTATDTQWSAAIPQQPDGTVVEYSVTLTLSDGSTVVFPNNKADPRYEFYVGPVTPLKCWDFEAGAADWTHAASPAQSANFCPGTGCDEWVAGPPTGAGGDPRTAHGGTGVLGIDLGADDGAYSPNVQQYVESPEVDLQGATQVRLQYWRWLAVEDGAYDQGTIFANDTKVWTNLASPGQPDPSAEINHVDREWRFQDVDLASVAAAGKIKLRFELDSDPGVELGGWTIDDVCIVAVGALAPMCGNGVVEAGEQCDDGNTIAGDGCSATCQNEGPSAGGPDKAGGGCCDAGGDPRGAAALVLVVIAALRRRRAGRAGAPA